MSTQRAERIPRVTLGWRLKMALDDIKRDEMAELLGVNPSTVSRWMADKGTPPKRAFLAQWAMRTNVPLEWLETGDYQDDDGPEGGEPGSSTLVRSYGGTEAQIR